MASKLFEVQRRNSLVVSPVEFVIRLQCSRDFHWVKADTARALAQIAAIIINSDNVCCDFRELKGNRCVRANAVLFVCCSAIG